MFATEYLVGGKNRQVNQGRFYCPNGDHQIAPLVVNVRPMKLAILCALDKQNQLMPSKQHSPENKWPFAEAADTNKRTKDQSVLHIVSLKTSTLVIFTNSPARILTGCTFG